MRNTIRKVTIVVPVLIVSCHVSERRNTGPSIAQTTTMTRAIAKAASVPVQRMAASEKRSSLLVVRRCARLCAIVVDLSDATRIPETARRHLGVPARRARTPRRRPQARRVARRRARPRRRLAAGLSGGRSGLRHPARADRSGARRRRHDTARAGCRSRSEEHTSELQSLTNLVCRLLLEKKNTRRAGDRDGGGTYDLAPNEITTN